MFNFRKSFISAAACLALFASAALAADPVVLRMNTNVSENDLKNSAFGLGITTLAEQCDKLSNGRLKVEIFPHSQLGKTPSEVVGGAQMGSFEMFNLVAGSWGEYTNAFLMTRASNVFFDVMVVAGIAAIRFSELEKYWGIVLILGAVGMVITFAYNRIVAKTLFKEYPEEQFLMMYGMLTGTASTGVILLREIDGDFKTPAADNMVYQNFPAIVFGFPMMLLATMAAVKPVLTLVILIGFFAVMNVILFRSFIFRRRNGGKQEQAPEQTSEPEAGAPETGE